MSDLPVLGDEIAHHLPFLRRYARALTGAQDAGDRYALAALEAVVADPAAVESASSSKVGLFRVFHTIWASTGTPVADDEMSGGARERTAQKRLRALAPNTREALLLHSVEGFLPDEVGEIIGSDGTEAEDLIRRAFLDMAQAESGSVMIIEDEAIIAMDLEATVTGMGHRVVGVARTREGATTLAAKAPPDLILADIRLADRSSGIDAVNDILGQFGDRPVIFITAFPERLLTGDRPEPAFLIAKPYSEEQVRAAVSQAMFFSSTAELEDVI